ncbi:MAG: porin [Planctomycetes bacterium]|nr:porin [Planctomycetota bacterium]MBL7042200.1 porin [Pirellulaceae bacterium]
MESRGLFPETCGGLDVGGWFQMGYHSEGTNGDGTGFFNNYPNVLQLQQAWIYAERAADNQGYGWDWGFRFDYVYGTDGQDTQAFGSRAGQWDEGADAGNFYGHAIPQLYADVVYNDVTVRVGHFYTFIGYETVPAPENFFYSKSGSLFFEPFTHTGVLAEWAYSDSVTFLGGWSLGWDTGFSNNGGSTFLGGVNVQLTDSLSFAYGATAGDFGFADAGGSDTDAYEHSIVLDWQVTERLNYVLQSDYLDNRLLTTSTLGVATSIFTVNQYLLYDLNDRWGVGGRLEWLKGSARGELWIATLGANWRPRPNLVVRPEIRYEDFDPAIGRTDQTLFGIDAIITF